MTQPENKPVINLTVKVFANGIMDFKLKHGPEADKMVALLLYGMTTGLVQSQLMEGMFGKAKTADDKRRINEILLYYQQLVKAHLTKQIESQLLNEPVVRPTQIFNSDAPHRKMRNTRKKK